ncbi:DUF192 domain-containing protein [Halanaeroarchaeum sulfurireducens]|uniref:DUF192 domain-containing protein n=1 Tax=Halanaeroarchaeum sulfurireducens TaxID=1604004 RepID=UPI000679A485|nr:DUF192 domain-containing protein [Halanaeroarchaeum sulfurireducens]
MPSRTRLLVVAILVLALPLTVLLAGPTPQPADGDTIAVTAVDTSGDTRATVTAAVAETPTERTVGLSNTESLAPNEGMLFVYSSERRPRFVMRDMDFGLDIVFVDANGTITAIHHAPAADDHTTYTGRAKWVLEVPYGWSDRHDVSVGDRIRIDTAAEERTDANDGA